MVDYDILPWHWENWDEPVMCSMKHYSFTGNPGLPVMPISYSKNPYRSTMEYLMCEADYMLIKWHGFETSMQRLLQEGWKLEVKPRYQRSKTGSGKWQTGDYVYLSNPVLGMLARITLDKKAPDQMVYNLDFMINKKFHRQVPCRVYSEDYSEIKEMIREEIQTDMEIRSSHDDRTLKEKIRQELIADDLNTCYTTDDIPKLLELIGRLQENYPKRKSKPLPVADIIELAQKRA